MVSGIVQLKPTVIGTATGICCFSEGESESSRPVVSASFGARVISGTLPEARPIQSWFAANEETLTIDFDGADGGVR